MPHSASSTSRVLAASGGGYVPSASFSLDGLPDRERYGWWRQSISCIFDVEASRAVCDERFGARLDAFRLEEFMLVRTTSMRQKWRRTPRMIAQDGMDHYMIQLFDVGGMSHDNASAANELGRDAIIVFDLAQPSTSRTGDFSNLSLILPRHRLAPLLAEPDDQHLRILSVEEPLVRMLRDHMSSLGASAHDMTIAEACERAPATLALVAACLNGSTQPLCEQDPDRASIAALWLRRLIDANLVDPQLSPEAVGDQTGLSPEAIHRVFEPAGGFYAYLRERRLHRARMTLMRERRRPAWDQPYDLRRPDRRYEAWLQFLAC